MAKLYLTNILPMQYTFPQYNKVIEADSLADATDKLYSELSENVWESKKDTDDTPLRRDKWKKISRDN